MNVMALLVCSLMMLALPGAAAAQAPALAAAVPAPAAPAAPQAPAPDALPGDAIEPSQVTCGDIAALAAENEAQAAEFALDLLGIYFEENGIAVTEEAVDRGFAAIDRGCAGQPSATVWQVLRAAR